MARIAYIALIGLVLGLAGCGADDGDGGGSAESGDMAGDTVGADTQDTGSDDGSGESGPDAEEGNGAGGAGSGEDGDRPTHAEYVERADAICKRARREIGVHGDNVAKLVAQVQRRKITTQQYLRRTGSLTARSAEIASEAVAELKALPEPGARRDALRRYLDGSAEQAATLAEQAEAQRRGDGNAVARLNARLQRTGARTLAAARQFGFRACGGA